jgi:ribonuclease HII
MGRPEHTVVECRALLRETDPGALELLIEGLADDQRAGVREEVARAERRLARQRAERDRVHSLGATERTLRARGLTVIAGVDEVGRGAIAGPVTAAAVVLVPDAFIEGLDDSKRVRRDRRPSVAERVRVSAVAWHVAHVPAQTIDREGIEGATMRAMREALRGLDVAVEHALVDGKRGPGGVPCTCIVGGDAKVAAIAAASVLAKVARDELMVSLDSEHPGYDLALNKGYCTTEHTEAVGTHGPSAVHRRSFAPCSDAPRLF